ncbi:MAG: hypothetical protein JSV17_12670 [Candidatus Aminicenantes bacterium]|nr:MAG: hypothetical protein JSV17_12670 [Candidatus Aminicenantes bacterium]
MKKFFLVLLVSILLLFCLYCGKKGNILPPLVRFPQTAENVHVTQRADQIILTWQNPTAYEDGSTLSLIEKIEIWVLEEVAVEKEKTAEIPVEEFEQKAKLHAMITKEQLQESAAQEGSAQEQMVYSFDLSGKDKDFLSKKYTFGVRVKDKKRYSRFSVLMSLEPMILPLPPTEVAAAVFPDRIEVTWNPPLENRDQSSPPNIKGYNIYRSEGESEPQRLNDSLIEGEKYEDKNFVFEETYRYFVRASATDIPPYLESENSEGMEVVTKDTFAPEPPKGLISVAGQNVLSISWDANTEEDLEGYRVWRKEESAIEFRLLTSDLIKESAYNDGAVERGKMYVYAVTALDKSGNESHRSKTISDGIREGRK